MIGFTDSFTIDASGSPDACIVPAQANGCRKVTLIPPSGHAWTLYMPQGASVGAPMTMDQQRELLPQAGHAAFITGETICAASLDVGSGTMYRIWE